MKYKVGDKPRVKSEAWWNENKIDKEGYGVCITLEGPWLFVDDMTPYLGKEVTITEATNSFYKIKEDRGHWCWNDKMLE